MPRRTEVQLAVLVAAASVLQVGESLLPHPLPGVRLGLANVLTMVVLLEMGPSCALQLSVLRTLVSSMVLGTFLTPTFVLSFAGGVASALVMILLSRSALRFGLVGISVAGAVSHVLVQLGLVWLLFIRTSGVLSLWPWLAIAAVGTGVLTGLIVAQAVGRIAVGCRLNAPRLTHYALRQKLSHRLSADGSVGTRPELKLAAAMVFGLVVVLFSGFWLYAAALVLLLVLALVARVRLAGLVRNLARVWLLVLVAFAMPVFFSNWGRVLFVFGPLRVTATGVEQGLLFSCRLILLALATALVAETTSPQEVAAGLGRLLAPVRHVGLRPEKLATTFSLSWSYYPVLMQNLRAIVARPGVRRGLLDRLVHLPGDVTAELYEFAAAQTGTATDAGCQLSAVGCRPDGSPSAKETV